METIKTYKELQDELLTAGRQVENLRLQLDETQAQLEEATDTIDAIRAGEIDALVINADGNTQLFTLKGSDQTYRIIIEQMTEGAVTVNQDGLILYCNSQFAAMMHMGMEHVTGQLLYNFIADGNQAQFNRLLDEGWTTPAKGELMLRETNGLEIPVLLSLNPLRLEEGAYLSVILTDLSLQKETEQLLREKNNQLEEAQEIARDLNQNLEVTVMERTRALEISVLQKTLVEKELRRNQEQLTRILETMVEGVQIIDNNGEIIYANPMAQRIMGITLSEGDTPYNDPRFPRYKMDNTELAPEEDPMMRVMRSGKPVYDFEISVQPPGRNKFYISLSAAPLKDEQDEVIGSIGTFMDVTQRRKVIQQKDEFISVASHELKTPVTSLKAALQLLNEIKDNANASKEIVPRLITQANRSLNKLSILIEDLLNVSKIRDGQLTLNRQQIAIYDVITETCEELHQEHRFNIRISGPQNLQVKADPDKIEQVLVNFLNNAMKYAADSKDIQIRVDAVDDKVKVSVTDQGKGIPADKLPHLFDRYYRVDNSGTQYSGLGLGLYICSEIIRKHNGEIGVDSTLGAGSTFWFTLPLAAG